MADNFNSLLRKNGFFLLFIVFVVSIFLILLVNGWILRQIDQRTEEKGVEQSSLEQSEGRFNPMKKPKVIPERVSSQPAAFEGSKPEDPSFQTQDKKTQEIPLDSKILIQ